MDNMKKPHDELDALLSRLNPAPPEGLEARILRAAAQLPQEPARAGFPGRLRDMASWLARTFEAAGSMGLAPQLMALIFIICVAFGLGAETGADPNRQADEAAVLSMAYGEYDGGQY